ncbi:PREDICTED: cadherin-related tumor suppressor-like [Priapulus caudatus]|uniref:Cadherin-related tumor suppressor-like n=1 Tax=Priapulus caudatus TaxID=37621 RepID=A0ABM1DPZ6_PRICU|nr:PREDICTED: cadherin-related tumor suppressor-like [Priapulus caudatus]
MEFFITNISANGVLQPRLFAIEEKTGLMKTADVLDAELGVQVFYIDIVAVDKKSLHSVGDAQVEIQLIDVNDSPPVFDQDEYAFFVSEDAHVDHTIGKVTANDPDTVDTVHYHFYKGQKSPFKIDPTTGVLRTTQALDRELAPVYELGVRASDGVHFTDVTVTVHIEDVNDNAPHFDRAAFSFEVPENSRKGAVVAKVTATDADEGANGNVSYELISDWGGDVFSFNSDTGEFTLIDTLDYEQDEHYIFSVQARDAGRPRLSSACTVYINVGDLNDNAPVFTRQSYSTDDVREDVATGSSIITVTATDADSGENAELTYSIVDGDPKRQFGIHANGTVYNAAALDRETDSYYNLVVRATDRASPPSARLSATASVTVILRDVNDMAPAFRTPDYASVREGAPLGTVVMVVEAEDADEGKNSYVEYSLASAPGGEFSLGPVDGVLRVTGKLDREATENYTLVVTATDKGQPPHSTVQRISVKILDDNDNSPVFARSEYRAVLPEDTSVGTILLQLNATDRDAGNNGAVRYYIVDGDDALDFALDPRSGILTVRNPLDHEGVPAYRLTVHAEDLGVEPRRDVAVVVVTVTDVNDSPPVFLHSPYVVYVLESIAETPAAVTTVTADDADSPPNAQLTYSLQESHGGLFQIDVVTGEIQVTRPLDRETREEYWLTVLATDSGVEQQLSGTGRVKVIVQDVNDHSPAFSSDRYLAHVNENQPAGTRVIEVHAEDADEGNNGLVRYQLSDGDSQHFVLDSATGQLVTTVELDRERQATYELTVVAMDSSGAYTALTSTATVTVVVDDENDHRPSFADDNLVVYIPHPSSPGQFVAGVMAEDPDSGPNGLLKYSMAGPDAGKFVLNPNTGVIKTAAALSEARTRTPYILDVSVSDDGLPSLGSSMKVQVFTRPAASFPRFNAATSRFTFSEDTTNAVVTKVTAVSPKSGAAGRLRYRIASGNHGNVFALDDGGLLRVTRGLDYETRREYQLWLEARDAASPPLCDHALVTVELTDANDNAPAFSQYVYEVSVAEGQRPPAFVVRVNASDADDGANGEILYRLSADGNVGNAFSIDAETGEVTAEVELDHEATPSYRLTVEATDRGTPPLTGTATIAVSVADRNDNPPRFTRLFNEAVAENSPRGTFIVRVTSSDADDGVNANASYRLTKNPGGRFAIDERGGELTVAGALDREEQEEYSLIVLAADAHWRIETPITVTLTDENDNAPAFERDAYAFRVPETATAFSYVGQVRASDLDRPGPNSDVRYALAAASDAFAVDAESGDVLTRARFRYASGGDNRHVITVVAADSGVPRLSSSVAVTIDIEDANDHAPVFDAAAYASPVPDNSPVGASILEVHAEDNEDYGENAVISYSIASGNGSDYFKVDVTTGVVRVAKSLHDRTNEQLQLDRWRPPTAAHPRADTNGQFAVDAGHGGRHGGARAGLRRRGTARSTSSNRDRRARTEDSVRAGASVALVVRVADVNDSPPRWQRRPSSDAYVRRRTRRRPPVVGAVLRAARTHDRLTSAATQRIGSPGGEASRRGRLFRLDARSGELTAAATFDYEARAEYAVDVVASDADDAALFDAARVRVHVVGENEYRPRFVVRQYSFRVSEMAQRGAVVGVVVAADEDGGRDGVVHYSLVGRNRDRGFAVQRETGRIVVAGRLDRERASELSLTVLAKNPGAIGGDDDTDTCEVHVTVEDANDPPVFEPAAYVSRVAEDATVGTVVARVSAFDRDLRSDYQQFSYSIVGGDDGGAFAIDARDGVVTTARRLNRETVSVYNLTVAAVDTGAPPQTGTASVVVTLDDVNDHAPEFADAPLRGSVAEGMPAYTSVMTLSASDRDSPQNGAPFVYSLADGPDTRYFTLEPRSGVLRTTRVLDRETRDRYSLVVTVMDSGAPRMTSTHALEVLVADVNDSPSSPRDLLVAVHALAGRAPRGRVADVSPADPDLVGEYACVLEAGDRDVFAIPRACELHVLRPLRADAVYTLNVSASDGAHARVHSTVRVRSAAFTNATLENSVTLRFDNVTADAFAARFYDAFVRALGGALDAGRTFEIIAMQDIGDGALELRLAVRRGDTRYVTAADVVRAILRGQQRIERESGVKVAEVGRDPCASSPCRNGGACASRVVVYDDVVAADAPSLVFVSPRTELTHACRCASGFTGVSCDARQDHVCPPDACRNGGSCVWRGGAAACACVDGYHGERCELDVDECLRGGACENGGVCENTYGSYHCTCREPYTGARCEATISPCASSPCRNAGACVTDDSAAGFYCRCAFGYHGARCEQASYGFRALSYAEFPPLDARGNKIAIEFSTLRRDALLLYNHDGRAGERSLFLALELQDGRPVLSYRLAEEVVRVRIDVDVSNARWYRLTAQRRAKFATLSVGVCNSEGCEDCHDDGCQASGSSVGRASSLNLRGQHMSVGGVSSVDGLADRPGQVRSTDFIGCIRSIYVNDIRLDLSKPLSSRFVTDTCPRNEDMCLKRPCGSEGICIDEWDSHSCQCSEGITKLNCTKATEAFSLSADGWVELSMSDTFKRSKQISQQVAAHSRQRREALPSEQTLLIKFRTRANDGMLFYAKSSSEYTILQLYHGRVRYVSAVHGAIVTELLVEAGDSSDGRWHTVTLAQRANSIALALDGDHVEKSFSVPVHDFLSTDVSIFAVGGYAEPIRHVGQIIPGTVSCSIVSRSSLDLSKPLSSRFVTDTCPRNEDMCLKRPCGSEGICIDEWDSHSCQCSEGITKLNCTKATEAFSLSADGWVELSMSDTFKRSKQISQQVAAHSRQRREALPSEQTLLIKFRTRANDGMLFYAKSSSEYTILQLYHGRVRYVSAVHGAIVTELLVEAGDSSDGRWHTVTLAQRANSIALALDGDHVEKSFSVPVHDFLSTDVSIFAVGGYAEPIRHVGQIIPGFSGCLSTLNINGEIQPLTGSGHLFDAVTYGEVAAGCEGPPVCSSAPCADDHVCVDEWHRYSCVSAAGGGSSGALHVGVVVAIIFFSLLFVVLLVTFVVFRRRRHLRDKKAAVATYVNACGGGGGGGGDRRRSRACAGPRASRPGGGGLALTRSRSTATAAVAVVRCSTTSLELDRRRLRSAQSGGCSGLTADDVDKLHKTRSSLSSAIDNASSSSTGTVTPPVSRKTPLPPAVAAGDVAESSSDESGNDSFTCSEFEYDGPAADNPADRLSRLMQERKAKDYDSHGSMSTIVASDDDSSPHRPPQPQPPPRANGGSVNPQGVMSWDNLLNWGPNFESLVGVFKDIASLDDGATGDEQPLQQQLSGPPVSEEYV